MSRRICFNSWLLVLFLAGGWANSASGQTSPAADGAEYTVSGPLRGDQMVAQTVFNESGGVVVWQDNATDGDGWGISAQRLNENLSPDFGVFRVNQQGSGDQENPQIVRLKNGTWVMAWQGGRLGFQKIFARFMNAEGIFITGDILVNAYVEQYQISPVLAPLANGNVLVVWSSYGQDGDLQGVFGQILTPAGVKVGQEFRLNQVTRYNQRTPVVAALSSGGFVAAWVSEQQRFTHSVDIYARLFNDQGTATSGEFLVNSGTNTCANPALTVASDGSFLAAWSENFGRLTPANNRWDIMGRTFSALGGPTREAFRINTNESGDQIAPRLCALGTEYFVIWTSWAQDGSQEGIYGQFISGVGNKIDLEFRINTVAMGRQLNPAVATDGNTRFLAVWSSYNGVNLGFDLYGQRYAAEHAAEVPQPSAPYANALRQSQISVTWPALAGYDVVGYDLLVDGKTTVNSGLNNYYVASGFVAGSTHTFQLRYRLVDGRQSAFSPATSATTWEDDWNGDGLPDDWQSKYWGPKDDKWWPGNVDTDGDGMTNYQEFLAGTNPTNAQDVLRTQMVSSDQGFRLSWNTQPGLIYQVQSSPDFKQWQNWGAPRFAAELEDSVALGVTQGAAYYRIIRIR